MRTIKRWWFSLPVGTRSLLLGCHCLPIHGWFVAWAWWRLYGFPTDLRLWIAFFVHDIGYWNLTDMDGEEGEKHVERGAALMHKWFDPIIRVGHGSKAYTIAGNTHWQDLCLYHSRFYAKKNGREPSRLCCADKLALVLTPQWLWLILAHTSGEVHEYLNEVRDGKYSAQPIDGTDAKTMHRDMVEYLRAWVEQNKPEAQCQTQHA